MSSIFQSIFTTSITPLTFIISTVVSAVLGFGIAIMYILTNKRRSAGFVVTVALLPAVVQAVIMMVNGNLGAGVAVAGAFSLIRFRSQPGTAKEICAIFIALAAGLATGMGYIAFAIIFTVIMLALLFLYSKIGLGEKKTNELFRLQIVIPENLNYADVFNDIFKKYTVGCELVAAKTTNMGSLFKLTYELKLKNPEAQKKFIDELRCRNGNLEISLGKVIDVPELL